MARMIPAAMSRKQMTSCVLLFVNLRIPQMNVNHFLRSPTAPLRTRTAPEVIRRTSHRFSRESSPVFTSRSTLDPPCDDPGVLPLPPEGFFPFSSGGVTVVLRFVNENHVDSVPSASVFELVRIETTYCEPSSFFTVPLSAT